MSNINTASAVTAITKENFEQEVLRSAVPVLLDFWAPWCGPCRMLSPTVDEIAGEVSGSVKVGKINIDEQPELAAAFNVMSIPTLAVVRDATVAASSVGVKSKPQILAMLGL